MIENRTRITPETDAPSEHLTDPTDLNGLIFMIKKNLFQSVKSLSADRQVFDPFYSFF
ncbi:hypothetical protein L0Z72_07970 [candidate division KSB1 bacterium]|nr:hypothetical protein [candidate division KSB1 bacterium]